jgi:site-specific DNA recombinase
VQHDASSSVLNRLASELIVQETCYARLKKHDEMVLGAVEQRVFAPDRLAALLKATIEHSQSGLAALEEEMTQQNASLKEAKAGLKRLYDLVETGAMDVDDPLLKERITDLKLQIREARCESRRCSSAAR